MKALAGALMVVLMLQGARAASADDYVAEAQKYITSGEIKSAVIELKNALQSDPSNVQARLLLGSLYLRNADGPAAAKEYGRARDLGAGKDQWLPGYTRALILQGDFRALLDEVQVDDSLPVGMRAELLALRGNANLALRQVDAAVSAYDAALQLESGNAMARLGKAQILLTQGKDAEALEQLNLVLVENPGHVESLLVRGDLLRRQQRLDEAAADFARAAQEAPANPRAFIGLALVHLAQRDMESAKKDLARLNQLAGDLPVVHYLQALVSFQDKDYERASDELQVLLRAAPANLQAQLLYGVVSYARNEFTIADDYLTRVLASLPGNVQVAKILGAARLKLRQPDRAVQVLSSVVNDDTSDAQLLALLGTAYIQIGDNTKGAEYIQRAVDLDPDQALLRTQLAVGKIATGDTAGAIDQLESAVALGQDVVQADVLLVLSYVNKREFDKAIAASEALEKRMSDSPIPYNLTGLSYMAERQFDQARAKFNQSIEKDPKFNVARMNLARLALAEKRLDVAASEYEQILKQDPNHMGALMGMAALAKANNDPKAVEQWLRRASQANPTASAPMLVLAETYLRQEQGLKALNALSGLSPEQARLPAALRLKGMAQLQTGDYPSAVRTLTTLSEQQPTAIEAWFQLARAQAAAGDADGSRESFKRAIALDTENQVAVIRVGLAELELRERRFDEALALAQQFKSDFPGNVFGYDIEAAAYRGKGDVQASLAAAEAALAIESNSRRVIGFANSLMSAGQQDKAVSVLEDWLAKTPDDGAGWATLGMLRQQMGHDAQALEAYEQAVTKAQPNPVILNNMAWLYLDRDARRAMELATQAYELAPSRAEIVDTYGWVLFKGGRRSEGLAALQQALVIAPRNAEIALHVGEALQQLNRDAEARSVLERIVRENPNTDFAESARALLAKLRG
ncbi:MAG: PEP-CTERM system TPR-repeat protein PrsT [Chromatiaceae bacterium]|nr:PEP-CTERM system TPR-repeat protein PrsT [Chromatiaceae bacterium]